MPCTLDHERVPALHIDVHVVRALKAGAREEVVEADRLHSHTCSQTHSTSHSTRSALPHSAPAHTALSASQPALSANGGRLHSGRMAHPPQHSLLQCTGNILLVITIQVRHLSLIRTEI